MKLIALLMMIFGSSTAFASSVWQVVSEAQAKWMWFDVYHAKLMTKGNAVSLEDGHPLSLQLCYQRQIEKNQLIEAAQDSLQNLNTGRVQDAIDQLHRSYQTVNKGDCYRLEHTHSGQTKLLLNDTPVFETSEKGFKGIYFGIWLGDHALSEKVRAELLRHPLANIDG
jgi:hypothetical protein